MPGVILGIKIEDRSAVKGLTRRWGDIQKQLLRETAEHWHEHIFPKHFGPSNQSQYHIEPRRDFYMQFIKPAEGVGAGKSRLEVLTGKSQRWMQVFVRFSGTSRQATVRMKPDTYFTNPFIGSFTDPKTGKRKTITRQPNKPDEVTRFSEEDRKELRTFAARRIVELIKASTPSPETTTIT